MTLLFRRILLSYFIIAAVLIFAANLYLTGVIKNHYITGLKEGLIIQARLIADQIPISTSHRLDDLCRVYKDKTGARVTIIDGSGSVIGDSDVPSEKMENILDQPEIKEASLNNVGSSIRFSNNLQKDFFYLAITINSDIKRGFLRLSMPLDDMKKTVSRIRMLIIFSSALILFIAIMVVLIQTGRITKTVKEITEFSKDVAAGNFKKRLFLEEKNELGELGKNIENMVQEIKARLQQCEDARYKMESILGNMSEGVMLVDIKGRILLCNKAIRDLFNIRSNIEGTTLIETVRNEQIHELIKKAVESQEAISHEIKITHPKELYLMAIATPFYDYTMKEKISGVVLTLHDITRLKHLEEMRRDFVANVSHEIRTPITAIRGFAETLLEGAIDDKENACKFLETIKNHSERLNSLVSDLLTLSRIEMGDIRIEKRGVDVDAIIDTVFTTLKDKASAKGLYLKKYISDDSLVIYADKDRLVQILLNLVDNGIKFTESGGVTAGIERRGEQVVLFVADTGIGIPKQHLPRLGERFYRVDRARSRELGGTGLGLAIVKHLVMAHGWNMEIESNPGKGTKIKIFVS